MARTGEWERQGIKIFRIGAHYGVGVGSILDVLGFSSGDIGHPRKQRTPASWTRPAGTPWTARPSRHLSP